MQKAAESLQSAQQALQQAGQGEQSAQNKEGDQNASDAEMGEEFRPGGGSKSGQQAGGQGQGKKSGSGQSASGGKPGSGSGAGMGGPGRGQGGNAGKQQPLPGQKKDVLVQGMRDPRGRQLSKSYMGTPDPKQDRAAYYDIVPEKIRAQESTLNREEIPAGYKSAVKQYFESIQPK
jgi:hypothetical protein